MAGENISQQTSHSGWNTGSEEGRARDAVT